MPTTAQIAARLAHEFICHYCGYEESTECARAALMNVPCGH